MFDLSLHRAKSTTVLLINLELYAQCDCILLFLSFSWDEYTGIRNRFETSIVLPTGFTLGQVTAVVVGHILYVVVSVQR